MRAFQEARGLRADGVCDENTWTALVEASWKLGDRLLFLTSPEPARRRRRRAAVTPRLGSASTAAEVDGILGPRTARALADFQRNCGLNADGVCGTDTVRAIVRGQRPDRRRPGRGDRPRTRAPARGPRLAGRLPHRGRPVRRAQRARPHAGPRAAPARRHGDAARRARRRGPGAGGQPLRRPRLRGLREPAPRPRRRGPLLRVPTFESVGGRALAEADRPASCGQVDGLQPTGARDAPAGAARDPDAGRAVHRRSGAGGHRCRAAASPRPCCGALELWISRAS